MLGRARGGSWSPQALTREALDVLPPKDAVTVAEPDDTEGALIGEAPGGLLRAPQDPRGLAEGDELARLSVDHAPTLRSAVQNF